MFLLSPHNGMIVHSGMVFGARKEKKKKENETPSILPLLPFTNHYWSNFVTPPADLNCSVAGANGMWVVWSFCKEEDSGSDEASGRDEAFAVPVNADSNLMCAPPASVVTSNINYEQLSNMMQNIGQNGNRKLQICI